MTLGQNMGGDLAGVGVHSDVELAPSPADTPMFLRVPLALAKQLQASAVQHEVNRIGMRGHRRLATGEAATTRHNSVG